jgi:ABC-type glycerol-3-phosphate transport system substrate-binding protein
MKASRQLVLTLAIVCLLFITSFSKTTITRADDLSGKLTVDVESWMVDKYNMKELAARFHKDHPGVEVEVITHEGLGASYQNIFLEWAQTGQSTADLYFGGLISQLSPAIIDDAMLPWDDMMVDKLAPDKWINGFLSYSEVPGAASGAKYPTLPGLGETINFQYNTKLFDQAKLKAPASYDDLYSAACKLAAMKVNDKPLLGFEGEYNLNFAPDTWTAAVVAAEGTYLTKDGKPNWDSEAGKQWIQFQKKIVDNKCGGTSVFTDNNGARNALKAGQAAIINASNSRLTEGTNALCPEKDTFPCKSGDIIQGFDYFGGKGAIAFSHQIYIPRVAKNVKLARAFAQEQLLSEYAQTWSALHYGKMPSLWANYDALPKNPNFDLVRAELKGTTQGQWTYRDGQLLRQLYVDNLQSYISGKTTLDKMIAALKEGTDKADLTTPKDRKLKSN